MVAKKPLPSLCRWGMVLSLLCLTTGVLRADLPTDPAARAKLIGTPKSLQIQPDKLTLSGPRATAQLVVTGVYADGTKINGPPIAASDAELIELLREIGRRHGLSEREFNASRPQLNVQLPDGSRLFATAWVCGRPGDVRAATARTLLAPDFTLPDLAGTPHTLSAFRGRKVLLASWASW